MAVSMRDEDVRLHHHIKQGMEDFSSQNLEHNSTTDLLKAKSLEHVQAVPCPVKMFIDTVLGVSSLK